ncbi:hypothetical protein GCM10010168_77780 [Actinoplanes ianthinogenes]|uniref:Uncharacterized protein n=1 Tax=Actinoplanes ianthinogenes TaxID=122358 RepID=A0ABM7LKH7_9ACTN|nr:hypothetical protein Aiant_04230 [Actinoplanes ianthinogenes]GGR47517.1 hypothetical protein GCM10010168_77780 [Actinoplanes ianthinogenes]
MQSADPARRTRARVDRLLPGITALLTDGVQQREINEAAGRVLRAAGERPAVALLAEAGLDHQVVSHRMWAPLLGDGVAALTPARTTIGYVTAVRLHPVPGDRTTVRKATASFLTGPEILRCRARLLAQIGDLPAGAADAEWTTVLELARHVWDAADSARQAAIDELAGLYRAQIFAGRFLGRDGVPVRLEAVHQATMPVRWSDAAAGRRPFPEIGAAGPYDADQDLGQSVLHRVFPAVRRIVLDVDVPDERWPISEDGLDLIDLPMLDGRLRTGRAEWLIETELAGAGAVVTVEGPQREAERLLDRLRGPSPTVLRGPDNYLVLRDGGALADLRAEICKQGQAACLAARAQRTEAAYEGFRQTVRRVVAALDETPLAAPPMASPQEMAVRDLLGRIGAELSAMTDDVERGIAGPAASLADGITPYAALRQWITTQVYAWPQWPALFSALRHHVLVPGDLPSTPGPLLARFERLVHDLPEACARVIDATVENWLRHWSVRVAPLKSEFFEVIAPLRDGPSDTVAQLRRGVQFGWLTEARPEPAAPPDDQRANGAVRAAFPLDPRRNLPWHQDADDAGGHGRHLMTVMRVRREMVVAAQRLGEERLADALAARVETIRRRLRLQRQAQQQPDAHVRALLGGGPATTGVAPQAAARRIEDLLERADSEEEHQ